MTAYCPVPVTFRRAKLHCIFGIPVPQWVRWGQLESWARIRLWLVSPIANAPWLIGSYFFVTNPNCWCTMTAMVRLAERRRTKLTPLKSLYEADGIQLYPVWSVLYVALFVFVVLSFSTNRERDMLVMLLSIPLPPPLRVHSITIVHWIIHVQWTRRHSHLSWWSSFISTQKGKGGTMPGRAVGIPPTTCTWFQSESCRCVTHSMWHQIFMKSMMVKSDNSSHSIHALLFRHTFDTHSTHIVISTTLLTHEDPG